MYKKTSFIFILIVFSFLIIFFNYFGYFSAYTKDVYSVESFINQYNAGIYKYRILGKHLVLETNELLTISELSYTDSSINSFIRNVDSKSNFNFYLSYFIVNTFFFMLSGLVLFHLSLDFFNLNIRLSFLLSLLFLIIISSMQFVLVPYDYLSYFFCLLTAYFFFKFIKNKSKLFFSLTLLTIILSTLNKETSALSISLILTIYLIKDFSLNFLIKSLPFILAFILPYFVLRLIFGFDNGIFEEWRLLNNLSLKNIAGILFFIVTLWCIFQFASKKIRKILSTFLVLSLPYSIFILITGITFEIRLWTPLLLNVMLLFLYFKNDNHQLTANFVKDF